MYIVYNTGGGRALDGADGSTERGAHAIQRTGRSEDRQKWRLIPVK
ncbi:RICIN domain-containing protein [Streptomyces mashuensis]